MYLAKYGYRPSCFVIKHSPIFSETFSGEKNIIFCWFSFNFVLKLFILFFFTYKRMWRGVENSNVFCLWYFIASCGIDHMKFQVEKTSFRIYKSWFFLEGGRRVDLKKKVFAWFCDKVYNLLLVFFRFDQGTHLKWKIQCPSTLFVFFYM